MTRYMCGDAVAEMLEIPREPFWDPTVRVAWPTYVALREGALLVPLAPTVSWTFDEILRSGVVFYLGEGQNVSIEMPTANRTTF